MNDLRRQLRLPAAADPTADDELLRVLQEASHLIESLTQRHYCPVAQTRLVSLDPSNPRELILPADLLELHALSDSDGALDRASIRRLPSQPDMPASVLQLADDAVFRFSASPINAVSISGIWGWHDRWSRAWRDSGDTVRDNPLAAAATNISVDDVEAADRDGLRPRFHIGHLLRIDGEYLRVTAIDYERQRLTVLRGQQGSAAASHRQGAKIETYAPAPTIRDLCLRYAELLLTSIGLLEQESTPLLERMRRLTA